MYITGFFHVIGSLAKKTRKFHHIFFYYSIFFLLFLFASFSKAKSSSDGGGRSGDVWPSTLWPCTKCDRNIFSFYEKIPLILWPAAAVSLQWISLPFRTIVAAIFCHSKYVTHVLCHTCSLAVLHVVMWRTKVSWSNTIQGLSNFVGGVSCHVITLLLRKMTCFFCDFRAILVSLWLLKEIAQANYYVLRHLSSFFQIKYQQGSQIWMFSGAYKNCVAQLFDGWDHGLFRFLYTRSLIYIL